MGFPVVESKVGTNRTSAETTSPITYPATISPGALLICIARCAVAGAFGWAAGWNSLVEDSSDASDDVTAIAWKTAVGNEDGTTFNITHGSGKMAAIVYSITGAIPPSIQPPQRSTVAVGTSTTPNPTTCTPTGGAKDYLWLWLGGWEDEQTSPPAGTPTNYINSIGADTGTAGAVTVNCRVAGAQRNLNAASEDPPLWTISASDDWSAWTMVIHPVVVVEGLASASGNGLSTSNALLNVLGVSAVSGAGLASSLAILDVLAQVQASGVGLATSLTILDILVQASGQGIGVASAIGDILGFATIEGIASGSGVGLSSSQGILDILAQIAGSGDGLSTGTAYLIIPASVLGSGVGESSADSYLIMPASVSASGGGLAEAVAELIALANVFGSGAGEGEATSYIIIPASSLGNGIGEASIQALLNILATSLASGIGLASANGDVVVIVTIEGQGLGSGIGIGITDAWLVIPNQAEGSGIGGGQSQPYVIIETNSLGSGLGLGEITSLAGSQELYDLFSAYEEEYMECLAILQALQPIVEDLQYQVGEIQYQITGVQEGVDNIPPDLSAEHGPGSWEKAIVFKEL